MSDQENDARRYAALVRAHGKIPNETIADWKRMVTDESYDFHPGSDPSDGNRSARSYRSKIRRRPACRAEGRVT